MCVCVRVCENRHVKLNVLVPEKLVADFIWYASVDCGTLCILLNLCIVVVFFLSFGTLLCVSCLIEMVFHLLQRNGASNSITFDGLYFEGQENARKYFFSYIPMWLVCLASPGALFAALFGCCLVFFFHPTFERRSVTCVSCFCFLIVYI